MKNVLICILVLVSQPIFANCDQITQDLSLHRRLLGGNACVRGWVARTSATQCDCPVLGSDCRFTVNLEVRNDNQQQCNHTPRGANKSVRFWNRSERRILNLLEDAQEICESYSMVVADNHHSSRRRHSFECISL